MDQVIVCWALLVRLEADLNFAQPTEAVKVNNPGETGASSELQLQLRPLVFDSPTSHPLL
jgi:hypothetical protein